MAAGGLEHCPAEFVVLTTGFAGPEPEDRNRVGLVYMAAAAGDGRTRAVRHQFGKRPKKRFAAR